MDREIILSIETAVHGGTLSLMANRIEIAGWEGALRISRAEDVLEQISNLLDENNIKKTQIKIICVSKGAGSLTGEKIGSALGRGLAKSLNCPLVEVDVFESLLNAAGNLPDGNYLTAVPSGKNQVQWQKFRAVSGSFRRTDEIQITEIAEFFSMLETLHLDKVILAAGFQQLCKNDLLIKTFKSNPQINIEPDSLAKLNAVYILRPIMS